MRDTRLGWLASSALNPQRTQTAAAPAPQRWHGTAGRQGPARPAPQHQANGTQQGGAQVAPRSSANRPPWRQTTAPRRAGTPASAGLLPAGLHQHGWHATHGQLHGVQHEHAPGSGAANQGAPTSARRPGARFGSAGSGGTHHTTTATPARASAQVRPNRPDRPSAAVSTGRPPGHGKHQPDAAAHQRHGLGAHGIARLVGQQRRHGADTRLRPAAPAHQQTRSKVRQRGQQAAARKTNRPSTITACQSGQTPCPAAAAAPPASGHKCPWPAPPAQGRPRQGTCGPPAQTRAAPGTGPACARQKSAPG